VGGRVYAKSFGRGNRVTVSEEQMDALFPAEPLVLRDRYEHVLLRRDGRLLEVTINRPEARNSLTPMILTGRRITAAEALGYGLVNRVTEAGQAVAGARALAAEILAGSPTSVRISLQVMAETRDIPDVIDAVTYHSPGLDELMTSEDMIEGVTAFAAKRPPRWRNR